MSVMVCVPEVAEALPPAEPPADFDPQPASRLSAMALPAPAPVSLRRSRRDGVEEYDGDCEEGDRSEAERRVAVMENFFSGAGATWRGNEIHAHPEFHYMRSVVNE